MGALGKNNAPNRANWLQKLIFFSSLGSLKGRKKRKGKAERKEKKKERKGKEERKGGDKRAKMGKST